ncbi:MULTISPECIES: hypothetical protein [unclassified Variovorax]|uniref:hypothetical protein n=1 Tax=unclassified Variovorax TaxID=663243 RepID=UPI0025758869|nr:MULTISPECIES: hypothetical protein [unclassified Variovorax]MDM0086948.1 hypothetical protein [Variovorax sp. J22G40]MDM0144795.1 hypothetical protein [Variovorax sp. J2P1-31]
MEKDRYVLFERYELADRFLEELKSEMESHEYWDYPREHPFDDRCIVSWNDHYLSRAAHLLDNKKILTPAEVRSEGWEFHPVFTGSFINARLKLDQAQFLHDGLKDASRHPNFPVYRALFFALLASFYSLKEAIKVTCKRLSPQADKWWDVRKEALWADPHAKYFHELNNAEKHHLNPSPLQLSAMQYGFQMRPPAVFFTGRVVFSAEGAFGIANEGTAREKRIYIPGMNQDRTVYLLDANGAGLGDPVVISAHVLRLYEDAVFDARTAFERKRKTASNG